ncbi:LysR family transcriptional regulator (chromosome initiation inhibitor) [Crenobacter luteus]|uniref:LysR family transcriptional regulator ArgP n=1 Tax=Crenobacter luteus TaxID=1452487 RepID=UPI00104ECDCC|nr:LysR family transcriptional regulator ArgP [Crenobacter luteus]TCP12099.1 LysR family transcriptional regulator (chromosome initiation inhibitor) [Crenobacter luteus]
MLDPKHLEALAAVVDSGGFDKAAERLFITQSAVSQRIRQLEERLGQPVLTRTLPVGTTALGRRLLQHYRQIHLLEAELFDSLETPQQGAGWTRLALGVNNDSLATWFVAAIAPVCRAERVLIDVVLDDQDYTLELMRQGHVLACVSTRPRPVQGGDCLPLGVMRYHGMASPDFARRHFPDGPRAERFAAAPAIVFSAKDDMQTEYLARVAGYRGDYPRLTLPSPQSILEAVRLGLGWSMVPASMAQPALAAGELLDLAPGHTIDLALYWHRWRGESRLMRTLAAALEHACRAALLPIENEDLPGPDAVIR